MSDIYKGGYSISVNGKWREIHGLNNCIDEINFIVDDLVEQVENLKEENKELKDEHYKDETIQKLEKEKRELQDQLYRTFSISKSENEAITEWKNQHWTNQHNAPDLTTRLRKQGAIGGSFTYEFVPTSIGTVGTIVCSACREKARRNCGNNRERYKELLKEYDAEFEFQNL